MDRLTKWCPNGGATLTFGADGAFARAINRLAAYEDTGLEPEQIKHIVEIDNEYVKASEEGRLLVLPCKEGTPIWKLSPRLNSAPVIEERYYNVAYDRHMQFGKDFFLTREEADAALGGDHDG